MYLPARKSQPWIHSLWSDSAFILSPGILVCILVIVFPAFFQQEGIPNAWIWLLLVVGIDVSHVYSTLFKTYFSQEGRKKYESHLILIPLISFLGGIVLYSIDPLIFWRTLAYFAVFHFVRQQYGFFRIYSREEKLSKGKEILDKITIYASTLVPIIWWHLNPGRNFYWFVQDDFYLVNAPKIGTSILGLYFILLILYLGSEVHHSFKSKKVNFPRNIILISTALSWYIGIVHFNGDLIFTLTNIVAHGIPYMAMVWFSENKKEEGESSWGFIFSPPLIPVYLLILFLFAYLEESIWDLLVWGEHNEVFLLGGFLSPVENPILLAILVPLLSTPQLTHYILDGYIWRKK